MSVVSFAALSRIVVVGAAAAAGTVLIAGAPARASGAWIELSPSTVQAGEGVAIKASCDENLKQDEAKPEQGPGGAAAPDQGQGPPDQGSDQAGHRPPEAKVTSKAFGEVPLISQWGFLVGDATVPGDTREGDYDVKLSCANGKNASTKLHVIGNVRPTYGPHTGGGGLAGDGGAGKVTLAGGLATVVASAGLAVALRRRRRLV